MMENPSRPEMMFLHGIPTNAALWQSVVERLAGVRAVAPDLPGYGDTSPPRNPSMSAYHRFISAVLASERMRDPILIGHDLGGLYALTYAIDNPGRLRALVLMNTTIYADPRIFLGLVPLLAPGFGEAYAWLAGRARYRELHRRGLASMYPAATPVETITNLTEPYGQTSSWLAVLRSLRGLNPVRVLQLQREMDQLQLPVLILWGEGDPYFPNAVPERLLRDLPRAELQFISDAGHFPMLSQPDLVARALLTFAENIRSG